MIVKRNLNPSKVWAYIRKPMSIITVWAVMIWALYSLSGLSWLAIYFTPIGIIGSALAIFVGFRNNSAYSRWWEARQIWGGIVNSSRVLARLIITFADSHTHLQGYDKTRSEAFKKRLVYKTIAWPHALRIQLRTQPDWDELKPYLSAEEYQQVETAVNKPFKLQMLMGQEIYTAMADGTLGGFDSFQMEGQLLALSNYQSSAERIKSTPLPKQYDYFTRLFVMLFALMLPSGLLSITPDQQSWFVIPVSIIVSGVFVIMERTGAAIENPFENQITDVPLSSVCNTIERNLKDILGEQIPEELLPENGYLN
jgi:putative membrane protein